MIAATAGESVRTRVQAPVRHSAWKAARTRREARRLAIVATTAQAAARATVLSVARTVRLITAVRTAPISARTPAALTA